MKNERRPILLRHAGVTALRSFPLNVFKKTFKRIQQMKAGVAKSNHANSRTMFPTKCKELSQEVFDDWQAGGMPNTLNGGCQNGVHRFKHYFSASQPCATSK